MKLLLLLATCESMDNTELRNADFSPTTLNELLPHLVETGLLSCSNKKTRGRWQNRYSLTDAGRQWLDKWKSEPSGTIYAKLYRAIVQSFAWMLYHSGGVQDCLDGNDLIRGENQPDKLKVTAELSKGKSRWVMTADWEKSERMQLRLTDKTFKKESINHQL